MIEQRYWPSGAWAEGGSPFLDYWLFNGARYRVYKAPSSGEGCEVRIEVTHQGPVSADGQDGDQEEAQQADQLNKELAPWAYTLSKWRCGTLATDISGLLEENLTQ